MNQSALSDDDYRAHHARYMAERTMTMRELSRELGLTTVTIRRHWKRLGLPSKTQAYVVAIVTEEEAADIARRVQAGERLADICEERGLLYKSLQKRLKSLGHKIPKQAARPTKPPAKYKPRGRGGNIGWKKLLDSTLIGEPRRVKGGYAVDVRINGTTAQTFVSPRRGRALVLAQIYVRALVREVSDKWTWANSHQAPSASD